MLTTPDQKALEALAVLTRQPRWRDAKQFIEGEIAQAMDRLLKASDIRVIGELQGRVRTLQEFLHTAATAEETLAKAGKSPGL